MKKLRTVQVFTYQPFIPKYAAFGFCVSHTKKPKEEVDCKITKYLYQIQINISINLESERIGKT